ncbi:MAG TPA: MEDS domain-containing protein [Lacunisphaera sp.]|nr:MEDS domain-containing protein [Lacunisphaera sp.]
MVREKDYIPETTKVRLIEIGVPAGKHGLEAIAGLFPAEFNIRALGLNAADLARVLIHFVEQKIVSLPNRKGPVCARKVGPGWHACHFYQDYDQLLDIIAPYVAAGLKNGEACLWVMPAAVTNEAAGRALGKHVDRIEACIEAGQLEMLAHPDWYLDAAGRLKSFEEIGAALLAKQDLALARGFKFLRAAGDTGWVSCTEQSKEFIDYENKVNAALQSTQVAAVCTYRADVTADELIAIVNSHQDAMYTPAEA